MDEAETVEEQVRVRERRRGNELRSGEGQAEREGEGKRDKAEWKRGQGEGKRDNKIIIGKRARRGKEGIQERRKKTGVTGET